MLGARNRIGPTASQIQSCLAVWNVLCGDNPLPMDVSEAARHWSRTRFDESRGVVISGADAYQGSGSSANARMSVLACLAHEPAHVHRMEKGFDRPFHAPDAYWTKRRRASPLPSTPCSAAWTGTTW
jgi:hypothetical protein